MKRLKLSANEIATLVLSIGALVVAIWAAIASRQATIQARRSEVRAEALTKIDEFRRSYSEASCVLTVGGRHSGQVAFSRFKSNLDDLQRSLFILQSSRLETLDAFEKQLDKSTASFGKLHDAVTEFKLSLTSDELAKANEICGVGG